MRCFCCHCVEYIKLDAKFHDHRSVARFVPHVPPPPPLMTDSLKKSMSNRVKTDKIKIRSNSVKKNLLPLKEIKQVSRIEQVVCCT